MKSVLRTITSAILLVLFIQTAKSQVVPPEHLAIKSANWEIINELTYTMDKEGSFIPVFSKRLKEIEGKTLEFKGYMVPFKTAVNHQIFALSVLPLAQCHFCGTGNIPPFIQIVLKNPIAYTDRVITVKGKVKLNPSDVSKLEIILEGAEVIDSSN